ncbi:MAG: SRPBCC family protein [Actinomycetia bacterium]|jgi:hypothetical protein|nr:SRPBCC family protein [Actinomycetes bacterium]MCH9738906.1 SRPBCC family protein [Actinomycetes bacterium]MCH9831632.1 SRPBCC family protein [Actinomycetes bacterium]MCH9840268.1 SRPBCC family protein [Actinomycetes bacterium]
MAANVIFKVSKTIAFSADTVFEALADWRGHADWVPLTKVEVLNGDGGPGTEFIATSGLGPLALPDRMRVDTLDREARTSQITKVGPVLTGVVDLTVTEINENSCTVYWVEDVQVPVLPQFLARPVAAAARTAFNQALGRMEKYLRKSAN